MSDESERFPQGVCRTGHAAFGRVASDTWPRAARAEIKGRRPHTFPRGGGWCVAKYMNPALSDSWLF